MKRLNNTPQKTDTPLHPQVFIAPAVIWQALEQPPEPDLILIDSAAEPEAFAFIVGKLIVLVGLWDDVATIRWNDWLCKMGATFIPVCAAESRWLVGPLAGMATNICLHDLQIQAELKGFPESFAPTAVLTSVSVPRLLPALADFWANHAAQDLLYAVYVLNFAGKVEGRVRVARFPYDDVCRAPLPPRRIHYAQQLVPHESVLPH